MVRDLNTPVLRLQRGHLRPDQVLCLLQWRYGSISSFDEVQRSFREVAQTTGVAVATVRTNIIRFHRNGNCFRKKGRQGRRCTIPEDIQKQLVTEDILSEKRFWPIRVRAEQHSQQFGIRITLNQLRGIYKKHRIRFRQPKVAIRLSDEYEMSLVPQRIEYAEKMKELMDADRVIIYADESTFSPGIRPGKTWMGDVRVIAPRNNPMLRNVTVYGAISGAIPFPVFLTSHTTNQQEFSRFIDHLIEKTRLLRRPVLVLDNHRAHKTAENMAKMAEHFEVVFQPPYSSPFNAQETVWARVKEIFRNKLYQRDTNLRTQQQFHNYVTRILDLAKQQINTRTIVCAPDQWLLKHQQLRMFPEYMNQPRSADVENPE